MPGTAQATPQLGDLGVKQSASVKASNGESLEGKEPRAIQFATYTAASVGNTIVGYDLSHEHGIGIHATAAAKAAGATDTNLPSPGKKTIRWCGWRKNLTDSAQRSMERKAATSANSPRQTKPTSPSRMERRFPHSSQDKSHHVDRQRNSCRESTPSWIVHRRQPHSQRHRHQKTTASIMMMNGTAVNGVNQLRTAGGNDPDLGQSDLRYPTWNRQTKSQRRQCTKDSASGSDR